MVQALSNISSKVSLTTSSGLDSSQSRQCSIQAFMHVPNTFGYNSDSEIPEVHPIDSPHVNRCRAENPSPTTPRLTSHIDLPQKPQNKNIEIQGPTPLFKVWLAALDLFQGAVRRHVRIQRYTRTPSTAPSKFGLIPQIFVTFCRKCPESRDEAFQSFNDLMSSMLLCLFLLRRDWQSILLALATAAVCSCGDRILWN